MKVIIMRGLPGSGKTTWIQKDRQHYQRFHTYTVSADSFFIGRDGLYNFQPEKLPNAHRHCLAEYMSALQDTDEGLEHYDVVYVDNTNLSVEEIAPYYAIAERYSCEVVIMDFVIDPELAAERNVHAVSRMACSRMLQRKNNASLPARWNINIIDVCM